MIELSAREQEMVEALFERALATNPQDRSALLEAFDGPGVVRQEVESLLQFEEPANARLDTPLVEANAVIHGIEKLIDAEQTADHHDPTNIGPYRIIRKLGEGGMGAVYLAQQEEPLRRQVALKVIKLGMDTRSVVARFDAERQALALMNHPHVARALDAGATEQGRPYFVMEFVDGIRITDHCDQQQLGIQARLKLFVDVCDAIQHAHQKGVIHRDIKPSNVLVCQEHGDALPKVIDFGVAKATHHHDENQTVTREGVIIGTPSYMSPEQADPNSPDVDTRSDIYSLGVLLYELLVGALPGSSTSPKGASTQSSIQHILDTDPSKPSTRLSDPDVGSDEAAQKRGMDLSSLRKTIRGDLDWIVMKCLERERDRRYATTTELIADVRRYLQHEPVEAGPPSTFYRARKYVRRNRTLVIATLMVFVSLITATTASTVMYIDANAARRQADQERRTAEEISSFVRGMLTSVDPRVARGRDVSVLREVLDSAAKRLESNVLTDPKILSALRLTIGNAYHSIGQEDAAEQNLRTALSLQTNAKERSPADIARAQRALGNYLRQMSRFAEAEELLRSALAICRKEIGDDSSHTGSAMYDLAILLEQTGSKEAEAFFTQTLSIHQDNENTDSIEHARALHAYAIYLNNRNRMGEARKPFQEALTLARQIFGNDHPNIVPMEIGVGTWARKARRFEKAEQHLKTAHRICRANYADDHPETLSSTSILAALYQDMRRFDDAETLYRETLGIYRQIYKDGHIDVATTANNLASLLSTQDRMQEAIPLYREAADTYKKLLGKDHYWVSIPLGTLAYIHEDRGETSKAETLAHECIRIRSKHAQPDSWQLAEVEAVLGACRIAQSKFEQAETLLLKSLSRLEKRYGPQERIVKYTRKRLGDLYDAWKKPEKAAKWR